MRTVVLAFLCLLAGTAVHAAERGALLRIGSDVFRSGPEVRLGGAVAGDALVAGGRVQLDGNVGGDVAAAGGTVRLGGVIAEDVYAAGGDVTLDAEVRGSGRLAGGQVELTRQARVAEGLSVVGGQVRIDGAVGSYAQLAAGEVALNGRVDGDVQVAGGRLHIGPDAVVTGRVTFRGPQPASVAAGAQIAGGVVHVPARTAPERQRLRTLLSVVALVWLVGWGLVGVLLLAAAPQGTRRITDTLRARPGAAALLGFALLVAVPAAIVLLAITLVGIPLALLLLCAYLLLLPIGYLAAVAAVGDALLPRLRGGREPTNAQRIGLFLLVLVLLFFLARVPYLGPLLVFIVLLAGVGAVALGVLPRSTPPAAAQPPAART